MYNIKDFNIESELLQEHWEIINIAYGSIVKIVKEEETNEEELDFEEKLRNKYFCEFLADGYILLIGIAV